MNIKRWFLIFCMAPFLASAAENDGQDGRTIFVQMGIEESFIVKLKPDWQVFRRRSVDLCFEDFLIKGPKNSFNLSMQFCYEDPDLLQYDTPEKQIKALAELTASLYDESHEKAQGKPRVFRDFAPAGRCGCAVRLTAQRWVGKTPPSEEPEGKFVTCALFRIGENSALFFQLWTNSVDDAAYRELLDFIAALCIPERGEHWWVLSDAAKAAERAKREFAKLDPKDGVDLQRPFNVHRHPRMKDMWVASGGRWNADDNTVNEVVLHGPTGMIACVSTVKFRPVDRKKSDAVK